MKLEVGGTYLTRNGGHKVRIEQRVDAMHYPYLGDNGFYYTPAGLYWHNKEDEKDLVERIDVPSMQEDFDPRLLPGTPIDIPAPEETPVAVGWSGRFSADDVADVWRTYHTILGMTHPNRPALSLADLIAQRKTLLRETE